MRPSRAKFLGLFSPLLILAAGCGAAGLSSSGSGISLLIRATKTTFDTNTTSRLSAGLGSGAAAVHWSITGGENDPAIGQGSIQDDGLYQPPPLLSQDAVRVEVSAALQSDPAITASYVLTVTPGFVQVLTPETASVAPDKTVQVTAEIAEVNAGSVHWSLAGLSGQGGGGPAYGSIQPEPCHHSPQAYTYCTAKYTAPPSLPPGGSSLFVQAAAGDAPPTASLHILLNRGGFISSPLQNQAAQTGNVEMGASGGNANDYDTTQDTQGGAYVNDCCGGTLGALVQDRNDNLYILSNNHVLAESDEGRTGDAIVQPALIDLNCNPQAGRTVGLLHDVVPLESHETNVDAALAAATPAVDPSGAILQLGEPASGMLDPAPPAAGTGETLTASKLNQLRVVKSGRTTGLTCSTVNTINLSVQVDYYYDCAETQPYYTKTYVDQIGIPGNSFADSGDSGALVLDAGNAEPIGLLFASGSGEDSDGFSVANPIQDVLTELAEESQADGQQFQIVGGAPHAVTCSNYNRPTAATFPIRNLSATQRAAAAAAAAAFPIRPESGILGLDTGASLDRPGQAALIVYVDKNRPNIVVPKLIAGVRTQVIPTDEASLSTGSAPAALQPLEGIHLAPDILRAAAVVQQKYAPQLMNDPAIFGVGVTESYDNPAEAALLVLVDMKKTPESMPDIVGGLRVRYMRLNRLHVTRSKFTGAARPTSCALRATRGTAAPAQLEAPNLPLP